jgi:hypothetical protein
MDSQQPNTHQPVTFQGSNYTNNHPLKQEQNNLKRFLLVLALKSSLQIVFMSSKNDCSAQYWPREPKLVSLELSGSEDSEYVFKIMGYIPWGSNKLQ